MATTTLPSVIPQMEYREGGVRTTLPLPYEGKEVILNRPSAPSKAYPKDNYVKQIQ